MKDNNDMHKARGLPSVKTFEAMQGVLSISSYSPQQ